MAQWVKVLVPKSKQLSSIPEMMKGKNCTNKSCFLAAKLIMVYEHTHIL